MADVPAGSRLRGACPPARSLAVGAVAVLLLAVGACSNAEEANDQSPETVPPTTLLPWPADRPTLVELTDRDLDRRRALAIEALDGLGFADSANDGPRSEDLVVVADHYVAWIDQTGFVGKMNGLWWIVETEAGPDLALREDDARPVNQFVVGERGDGSWPTSYQGAEHIEFPNTTPDEGDGTTCLGGPCDQYAHDEAIDYENPGIPWWVICNETSGVGFDDEFAPIEYELTDAGLRVVFESPLVKLADMGLGLLSEHAGDHCHDDWLSDDGTRAPVALRLGYELPAQDPWIDRVMQLRNGDGNPPFVDTYCLIGGFVLTSWPSPHPLKDLDHVYLPDRDRVDERTGITLAAGQWTPFWPSEDSLEDTVHGWVGQPVSLSTEGEWVTGRTLTMSHLGPTDNDDTGFCFCVVHGALEMGGGLIHLGDTGPLAAGESSIEAVRRLEVSTNTP